MQELSPAVRRDLRARAHHLDPVVSIAGNGLTANVLKEIDVALKAHELIKIRVYGDDREARAAYLLEICSKLDCAAVQNIGKLLVVFRLNPELHVVKPVALPKRPSRSKKASQEVAFDKRPGRPTTSNAPRKSMAGAPETRYRKPSAGSSRTRKSAR
ncbi:MULTISPECIES: YhbY family RNA-binding protein [Uliginosibacterium]|uniref:YhbY family RNA-binding protein n=1 Tax=Uliginosibacterium aquaticum TaxID=2731212 RepID=A0ABX2IKR7_9RHOO|nr:MULTISPECIES: YhbY family RNA-binding protein [Uliginosibacterium]MDO6386849.1 YhbY family RNA-binding protein [Uliginosibacterium sp. 31-12]NSL54625.1 YhbY family RNA-binding protein [Uliginosibacterium aquaticum]PLK48280.1 ribosome assembly RNA-binding protein YhbY [Uliginosibacterium sp. TH139]